MTDKVDISDLVEQICDRLDLGASYVYKLELEVGKDAAIHMYLGRGGICHGPKFVVDADGVPLDGRYIQPGEAASRPASIVVRIPVKL